MPYAARDLSVLAYANGFTLWHYRAREPLATVLSQDYFTPGQEMFRPGDFLMVNADGQGATLMVAAMDRNRVSVVALNAGALPTTSHQGASR
jgi:hypothetical protein